MKGKKASTSTARKGALSKKAEDTNLKRKTTETKQTRGGKGSKAKKDPNRPKRPASAFFVFLEEFRKTYKAEHPGSKSVAAVGKAGGEKWKSMSEADKAPYVAKAQKRKDEYEKSLRAYQEGESDKSKSEINGEEEGSVEADEELEEEEEE